MKTVGEVLSPDKFSLEPETLICYGFDASGLEALPSAVVWPENTDDVARISEFAYQNNISICPRGAGTGTTGGAIPLRGSIVISFERMNRILEVDSANLTAVVEPGLINGKFQRELETQDLFYPPDPSSMNFCTIGGNVAENAGGPRAVKYGVTRDYVLEIEGVLPDGRILNTGERTMKGVVGYDLTRLLVGSEGTLCTITKIRLSLLPAPGDIVTLLALFNDVYSCGTAVSRIISAKVIPRSLELMDEGTIRAVEKYSPVGLPGDVQALLLIELDGHPHAISQDARKVSDICSDLGAEIQIAEKSHEKNTLWEARRSVSPALYHICPTKMSEDVVVPRNRIPDLLFKLRSLSVKSDIDVVNFGHAGDGNIHVNIMANRNDPVEAKKADKLKREVFRAVLELNGTISGEHGIGLTKSGFIDMELRQPTLDMMRGIKRLFDPKNILNPGKIFP